MARRSKRPKSGYTILVVDDDEGILASVRTLLDREGHTVLTAPSGPDALQILKGDEVHLLVVDYFMPRMTGEELIEEVRRFDPTIQIVLQTGYSGEKPPRDMLRELDIQGYHDKGRGPGELLIWVDVALKAHHRLAELKERERLQAELVANVSHEFRTPLNIIGGYTDLLIVGEFGELDEQPISVLKRVYEACRNLSELVGDFLRYARVEARVEAVGRSRIETCAIAGEMQRYAEVLLDERKQITLEVETDCAPEAFYSDIVKVRTILRNLLTNAAKFTEEGRIRLSFAGHLDGSVSVAVSDTGPGIASESQELIFEPFRQLDGSPTRSHGGVGLGLALSRKLARLLGGDLTLASTPGQGATFTVHLPGHADQSGSRDVALPVEAPPPA